MLIVEQLLFLDWNEDVFLQSEKTHELSQKIVFSKHAFSLMRIERLEVLARDELFFESFLDIVLFKHRVFD